MNHNRQGTGQKALRWLAVASVAAMAAACASVDGSRSTTEALAGAPSPIPDYDWHYHVEGGEASLVFGMAESDDVMMGLSCQAGSGKLDLFAIVDAADEIHLESGGDTERFSAVSEPSELHGRILNARADTDVPVFKRFRRLGWMASLHDGRRDLYVAHPESATNVERFFVDCG